MCVRKNEPRTIAVHQNKLTEEKAGDGCQTKFLEQLCPGINTLLVYGPQLSPAQMAKGNGARALDKLDSKKSFNQCGM